MSHFPTFCWLQGLTVLRCKWMGYEVLVSSKMSYTVVQETIHELRNMRPAACRSALGRRRRDLGGFCGAFEESLQQRTSRCVKGCCRDPKTNFNVTSAQFLHVDLHVEAEAAAQAAKAAQAAQAAQTAQAAASEELRQEAVRRQKAHSEALENHPPTRAETDHSSGKRQATTERSMPKPFLADPVLSAHLSFFCPESVVERSFMSQIPLMSCHVQRAVGQAERIAREEAVRGVWGVWGVWGWLQRGRVTRCGAPRVSNRSLQGGEPQDG